ncbi:hypothetical protein [Candidatus Amarolinea dominans]|uniref:hypothetical protein n=1 Tax=Candidatus Amarolinea dominans TaxID=3140696 RepID=UPI0031352D77|nr:hypothetical protein [Anaerolineae bacterium]
MKVQHKAIVVTGATAGDVAPPQSARAAAADTTRCETAALPGENRGCPLHTPTRRPRAPLLPGHSTAPASEQRKTS